MKTYYVLNITKLRVNPVKLHSVIDIMNHNALENGGFWQLKVYQC